MSHANQFWKPPKEVRAAINRGDGKVLRAFRRGDKQAELIRNRQYWHDLWMDSLHGDGPENVFAHKEMKAIDKEIQGLNK